MLQQFSEFTAHASGSQSQIVNEQEQNREVNAGGLKEPEAEKTPDGSSEDVTDTGAKQNVSTSEKEILKEEQENKTPQK